MSTARRLLPGLLSLFLVLAATSAAHAQTAPLNFFKSYFETGGHFAAGVSLKGTGINGFANGTITIQPGSSTVNGIPAGADVLAAFLYWQTVTSATGNGTAGALFNGAALDDKTAVIAKSLNPNGTAPCWSSGGATGDGGAGKALRAYRADVLPFLPVAADGRRTAVGTHTVRLPDSGSGNNVPSTLGASLLVVYRAPGAPLTATVIYDGAYTMNNAHTSMVLPLEGWYQAAFAGATASLTQIVANGQPNFSEVMTVKDANQALVYSATNPFIGPAWDTHTVPVPLPAGSASATLRLDRVSPDLSFDCLTWGTVAMSVAVQDTDSDGIIDKLESQSTSGTVKDPTGQFLPNLYAMGARPDVKDIFIELGYMKSTSGYTKAQTVAANHSHLPSLAALGMVAKSFRFAPEKINVHFDVGNNYQSDPLPAGGWNNCWTGVTAQWTPACAIVRTADAEGGESIEETPCTASVGSSCLFANYPAPLPCVTPTNASAPCQFAEYPGTVGWKSGFRTYRDEALNLRKTSTVTIGTNQVTVDAGPDERACYVAETDLNANGTPNLSTTCKRRFSSTRKGLFHYVLFAHTIGIPKSDDPLNAGYHAPKNMSGIGDVGGGDFMVTLGLWDNAVGTPFMQASTLMHELGHNLGRRHGGDPTEPNCKPNYQSVMNYLFQVRGLITATGATEVGFSKQQLPALNENNLVEGTGLGTMDWRTRWYVPWNDSFIDRAIGGLNTTPATKRCNGTPVLGEVMARVDGVTVTGAIDWNVSGATNALPVAQDVNFSATVSSLNAGSNDWNNLDLRQVASRRNVGGWSVDSGYWDAGYWDAGYWDAGAAAGYWDAGYWDAGYWDAGYWDAGYWDAGYWDAGVEQDSNVPIGELDLDIAESVGNPPNGLGAAVVGKTVVVSWTPPNVGSDKVHHYEVYRVEGSAVTPANFALKATISALVMAPATSVIDSTLKNNVTYTYIALAVFNDGRRSGITTSQPFVK